MRRFLPVTLILLLVIASVSRGQPSQAKQVAFSRVTKSFIVRPSVLLVFRGKISNLRTCLQADVLVGNSCLVPMVCDLRFPSIQRARVPATRTLIPPLRPAATVPRSAIEN